MTLQEAIKINESLLDGTYDHRDENMEDALKLGIEALRFRLRWEQFEGEIEFPLLPGQTKE